MQLFDLPRADFFHIQLEVFFILISLNELSVYMYPITV